MLLKMLMVIDPLLLRGSMVMISPSRRDVSSAEQLRQSPRLVWPGFASWRRCFVPKASSLFFLGRKTSYSRRWSPETCQGAHKIGGRALGGRARPHPHGQGVGPLWLIISPVFFIYSKTCLREVSGLLELCRIGL